MIKIKYFKKLFSPNNICIVMLWQQCDEIFIWPIMYGYGPRIIVI